ncbi:MAG: bifunctional pyr operon transcriptional regulator/uracil phosphoribosyltransferase PyrR [Gammaproteobacteria bacterium]|nr:MAG: bifunctional pyr operon transcriptional regulator/uracil phosphoribosyltransferase PyrR [Gammaproteobacteria bacterium]RLA24568.1 MAG: bifunctional pyr operon transcriptional regulator/uracil phosphoribosyltransferase PyrR [Gammaproteobacteria bacterium]
MSNNLDIQQLLNHLESGLRDVISERRIAKPLMIGIHTGGGWVAEVLHKRLELEEPLGLLNISFYRDDFSQIGMHPQVAPSSLPVAVEGRDILLIDDVLFTGRTIRAALNEIFDYGRPNQVALGVLLDRGERQLPFQPDAVGGRVALSSGEQIKLSGPEPLALSINLQESR